MTFIKFAPLLDRAFCLTTMLWLTACATAAPATLAPTPPAPPPTATLVPPTVTPLPVGPRPVTFTTADGVTLSGTLYGQGRVAVIFSNMGDKHEDSWAAMAQAAAAAGYLALTYEFRYWVNGKIDNALARHVGDDLSAAMAFAREQGAERVALVGASLGGMASAKVGASAAAVIILGSPLNAPSIKLNVETAELQAITAPKLFITSERDNTVDASALKEMYALALDPKELYVYPGIAHGTEIFKTEHGDDLRERLLTFITAHAPADGSAPVVIPSPTPLPALFTVYGDQPIVPHGLPGAWDDRFTDPGAVIYYDGIFHMFRNGFREFPGESQVEYVTSPDGYTWTKQPYEPMFKTSDVPYAKIAMYASSVIRQDNCWVLYFYTWDSKDYPSSSVIGRAAECIGGPAIAQWFVDSEPVLQPGANGEWDDQQVLAPHVLKTDAGYRMYYSGVNASGKQRVGMATSNDGVHWTKYNDPATTKPPYAESDPVLTPGESGAWDDTWVHQAQVHPNGVGWVMLYRGTHGNAMALGYALSADGLHWQKSALNPILKPSAVKSAQYFWFTNSLYHDDTYFLFWEIDKAESTEIYLATHTGQWP